MKFLRHIPNALTCGNLVAGTLGITSLLQDGSTPTAYFIWVACVFDFLDGFAARWLKVTSPIGKELDSLADMVSFGALPALAMFTWMTAAGASGWLPYSALLLAVFSALRLAKFNVDERQTDAFIGVPTPANALFITALPFLSGSFLITDAPYLLLFITVLFSYLLVSPFELVALKFKQLGWKGNELRWMVLALAAGSLLLWGAAGIVPAIIIYILLSLWKNVTEPKR